jgi:hypothetical protein
MKQIAETWLRYGYGRVHVLLKREGCSMDGKWICKL